MAKRSDSKPRVTPRKKVSGLGKPAGAKGVKPTRSRDARELEQLRALLNHSADAMMWVELPSGRILRLNAISRELLEMDPKEKPKVTLSDILSATAVDRIMALAQEAARKAGRLAIVTDAFRCPSGMVIPVEMTVGVHVIDKVSNALIVARDISDRMQAEQALNDAHHKIQGLVSAIPDVLYFKDAKGRNQLVNKAFETLVGMSAEQIVGKTDAELLPPDLAKHCEDSDRTTIESGQSTRWEEKSVGPDGKLVHFDTIKVPLFDDHGKLVGLVGVSRDITDRKQSEQALRDSELRYRTIFESIQDVYFETAANGTLLEVSPSIERLSQFKREELIGASLYDIYADPGDRDVLYRKLAADGYVEDYEIRLKDKDGSAVFCSINARIERSANGKVAKTRGTMRDITERKRTEQALQQRESYLTAIIENQPGLMWLKDEESRFLAVNHAFARSCGKEHPEELIGKTDIDVWPRELAEQYRNDDRRVIESGTGVTTEEQIFDQGEMRWFETFKTPVRSAQGQILGTTGFARDVTDRKRAERRLQESEANLSAILGSTDDIIASYDRDVRLIVYNTACYEVYRRLFGVEIYAGLRTLDLFPESQQGFWIANNTRALSGETFSAEFSVPMADGELQFFETLFNPICQDNEIVGFSTFTRDITERKRAEEALRLNELRLDALVVLGQMTSASLKELADFSIEKAIELTGSTIGYLAFMNEDETVLTMYSWSREAMAQCRVIDKPMQYPVDSTGLWGEAARQRRAVVTNDYAAPNSHKKGCPEGHVPITRHLGVPIFDGDKIVAVAGVGNKPSEYNEGDIRQMTLLMSGMWRLIRRAQADEALKHQKDRFGYILEGTNVGTWEWNVQTGETIFNDRWANIIGYSLEELSPASIATWTQRAHPDDWRLSSEALERHFRGEQDHYEMECRLKHRDGHWVWVLDRGKVISWTDDGKPLWMYGTHQDITERKQAEEALVLSEQRFRTLFEHMQEGVALHEMVYNEDGKPVDYRIVDVNPAYEQHTGLQPSVVRGRLASEVYGTPTAPYLAEWAPVAETGNPHIFETYFEPMQRHFRISAVSPGRGRFATVFQDITTQKLQDVAIREREEKLRSIFKSAPIGIGMTKGNRLIVEANEELCRMTGYAKAELLDQNARLLYQSDEDYEYVGREKYRQIAETGTGTVETRWRRKDGAIINVVLSSSPLDRDDLAKGVTFTAMDITDRICAEEALRESDARYRSFIEHSSEGIYRIDIMPSVPVDTPYDELVAAIDQNAVIMEVNEALAATYGLTGSEMIGRKAVEFASEYGKRAALVLTSPNRHVADEETMDVSPAGRPVWLSESFHGEVNDGRLERIWGVQRDITERKQAEEKLQRAHHRLDQIIEFLPDATLVIDTDGRVIAWNRAMEQMSGVPKEEMIGKGDYAYSIPFYGERRRLLVDLALLPDGVFEQQHYVGVLRQHDALCAESHVPLVYGGKGAYLSGISTRLLDAHGTIVGAIESIRDITERKVAEAALRYRSDFEKLVSEISTRFISIPRDAVDHEIEEALERVCRFTGTDIGCLQSYFDDQKRFRVTHLRAISDAPFAASAVEDIDILSAGWWYDRVAQGEVVAIDSVEALPEESGREKALLTAKGVRAIIDIPLLYRDRIVGMLGLATAQNTRSWSEDEIALLRMVGQVFTNALQRKRFEEEREVLEGQLRQSQKMQAVGQLAGGVAHDFNNLLQVINGYTQMAIELLPFEDEARANLEESARASERAATLVRQLLTFGRRETLHQQYVDLNDVISDLMKMLRRVIGEHIDLKFSAAPGLSSVYADPGQIEQILMNLCVNARDAMADGGTITIETLQETFDAAYCHEHSWAREGEFVALSVSDTGTGIAAEVLEHIFEPFFTTKEVGKGTGLGLATVYAITERHGGFLHVESAPGKGSTFRVCFPAVAADRKLVEVGAAANARQGHGETLLLAEDDELVRELSVRILERANYKVVVACDGEEAVNKFRDHQSEIVLAIIDVVMPKRNGREVCEIIRKLSPDLPVLFSSGYSYDELGDTAFAGERVGQIQKPFRPHKLIKSIQDMLAIRSRS